jgi:hypothetical protein
MSDERCDQCGAPAVVYRRSRGDAIVRHACAQHAGPDWLPMGAMGGALHEAAKAGAVSIRAMFGPLGSHGGMVTKSHPGGADYAIHYDHHGAVSIRTSDADPKSPPLAQGTWKNDKLGQRSGGLPSETLDWIEHELAVFFRKAT